MILCIDVGNTHTVLGVFDGKALIHTWRLKSDREITSDELAVNLFSLLSYERVDSHSLNKVVIGSVVPVLTRTISNFVKKYLKIEPKVVISDSIPGMKVLLDQPSSVGADRIVNGFAARELYGAPLVVVDFGTATTFDVVNLEGNYEGGVIAPGMLLAMQALSTKTALLPTVEIGPPSNVIGKNTVEAMRSGIFTGFVCMTEGLIGKIVDQLEFSGADREKIKIIGTGGLSTLISQHTSCLQIIDRDLTLKGLHLLA